MKVVIFGASGKTGINLVNQALNKGYEVTAYVRRENSINIVNPLLKVVVGQLNDIKLLEKTLTGCDICFSVLGGKSLRKRIPEFTNGLKNIVKLLESKNVNRFIYLSSLGAGESRFFMKQPMRFIIVDLILKFPLLDHSENEEIIKNSGLDWTIVRPGSINDDDKIVDVVSGSENIIFKGNPKASRASVASFMLNQISNETYSIKAVWIYE